MTQAFGGSQSIPIYRLPILLMAPRKFTYDGAMLDVKISRHAGVPGDVSAQDPHTVAAASAVDGGRGASNEDIPGVPTDAWVRVQRGTPPADPYSPGEHNL